MAIRVVSFTHYAPYGGCHWETHYMAPISEIYHTSDGTVDMITSELVPIVWPNGGRHKMPHTLRELSDAPWQEDLQIERWEESYSGHANWTPSFWAFAQEHDLPFVWTCDYCGETAERPVDHGGNYGGNGGVGITVHGWLCEMCYCTLSCSYCGEINNDKSPWWDYDEDLVASYDRGTCPACGYNGHTGEMEKGEE